MRMRYAIPLLKSKNYFLGKYYSCELPHALVPGMTATVTCSLC